METKVGKRKVGAVDDEMAGAAEHGFGLDAEPSDADSRLVLSFRMAGQQSANQTEVLGVETLPVGVAVLDCAEKLLRCAFSLKGQIGDCDWFRHTVFQREVASRWEATARSESFSNATFHRVAFEPPTPKLPVERVGARRERLLRN